MNSTLNNRPVKGLFYALSALARDPREVREFKLFLNALVMSGNDQRECFKKYCTSDQVILNQIPLGG